MPKLKIALLLSVICVVSSYSSAEEKLQPFPGIERLMTEEQYKASGMEKLNAAEKKALNDWLIGYTIHEAETIRTTNETVRKVETDIKIEASVKEPFKGWRGETVFYLDNGQIWKQRLSSKFAYNGDDNRVVIQKNFVGFYKMTHVESGRAVGVKRIK